MIVAMAGLPGTGKSAIAARLAERLNGVVLSKDEFRARLFQKIDYSREQDDAAMQAVYAAARELVATGQPVIIDGRTFSRSHQIADLFAAAEALSERPLIIECICDQAIVRQRLDRDSAAGTHLAGNRTFAMYREVRNRAEALTVPRLVLDTGVLTLAECVSRAEGYLVNREAEPSSLT
jgi:adenylylsulfate kinase